MNMTASDGLGRQTRFALLLFGLLALPAAILIGLSLLALFGTIFAHNSNPTPELISASRAAFIAPVLLLLLGISSLACVKRKHLIVVVGLAAALFVDVVAAKWLYELGTRPKGVSARPVTAELPAPLVLHPFNIDTTATAAVPSSQVILDQDGENGVATTSVSTVPVDVAPVTTLPVSTLPRNK